MKVPATIGLHITLLCVVIGVLAVGLASDPAVAQEGCPVPGYTNTGCPVRTDAVIRDVIESRLAGSVARPGLVTVEVCNGAVTLRGVTSSCAKVKLATLLAWSVDGVVSVDNRLRLLEIAKSDAELAMAVKNALGRQMYVSQQVNVWVADGTVRLTGEVATMFDREQAGLVAEGIEGVKAVQNNLVVNFEGGGPF